MKVNRLLWSLSILFVLCALAHADGIPDDPRMVVDDPECTDATPCQTVDSQVPFTFQANATGGGTFNFLVNPDGPAFTTLNFETPGVFSTTEAVNCTSNEFVSCHVTFIGGVTNIFLSNPCEVECPSGFFAGDVFSVDLDDDPDVPNVGSWGAGRPFTAIANITEPTTPYISAPEPSVFLLLGTGALGLITRRRLLRR